jgi:hypothetical protein
MAIQYDRNAPVLENTAVDNINGQDGVVDELASLDVDVPAQRLIQNLNSRIKDSEDYWNNATGYDLKDRRNKNERLYLNRNDEKGLYKYQKAYKENQIYVAEESIISYVTSQVAGPKVVPASTESREQLYAANLEKVLRCHSDTIADLESLVEISARNILNKAVAVIMLRWDEDMKEVIAEAVDPRTITLDKNCRLGGNPEFICRYVKSSPEKLLKQFPKKEKDILETLGIKRKTPGQMTREIVYKEVWLTNYTNKGEPEEIVVSFYDKVLLGKLKNPNYLYARKDLNILPYPKKPFIFGNLNNDGTHLIDQTTPLEQAAPMQEYLNRRGRQIMENADKANGTLIIATESGLSKDDGQDLTGDPNQKLFIKGGGQSVENLVHQLQAQVLPEYVVQDKLDARMQVGNIMGAPTDFTGSQADDGDPTLGEVMLKKNQAAGRQDMMVRAMTRMIRDYYEYLAQMMVVWYTDEHQFTFDGGDGEFDVITMKRDLVPKGVRISASKPANPDRSRVEAIALKLLEQKGISLLDAYRLLQLDNPQQLYDNWVKQSGNPQDLARTGMDAIDESAAYVAYEDILNGKKVDEPENPSKEYILTLRKLMINDEFLKAKRSIQNKFIAFVNKCIDSFEVRMQLDDASKVEEDPEPLRPGTPLPPLQPPMQPGMGQPGMPPQGMPPGQPMPGAPQMGQPMPSMNGMPGPQLPAPTPQSVFGGTPIPAPGQAPMPQPGNPSSLPMV